MNRNEQAWKELKNAGLTVDVQVCKNEEGSHTAFVGTVYKDRRFAGKSIFGFRNFPNEKEARRDTRAVARAISRETGIPLHPSVPAERQKQVSSHTLGRAQLQSMYEMDQRQIEKDNKPNGFTVFLVGVVMLVLFLGGLSLIAGLFS